MPKERASDPLFYQKNEPDDSFRTLLDDSLKIFFKNALRISVRNPGQAFSFFKTVIRQKRAARLRAEWKSLQAVSVLFPNAFITPTAARLC